MATISVVINTYNAQRVLRQCLAALDKADEIIVCDMYSTDDTVTIAKSLAVRSFITNNRDMLKLLVTGLMLKYHQNGCW